MENYLLKVTETYRVPTVKDALAMRDAMNQDNAYELQSFSYTTKFNKKTEEEYQIVKVTKIVNSEKDPTSEVHVVYEY